ncbi:transcriptional regulator [Micromonospora sp. STR1_7]|uniref:Transcriptional regulator n=1 Tax=Micromonospora parastrephiae TaxID=2806101 RepID=A0ABS1XPZ3_9ACTN|nr:transcriptional regulator [Micromonospora parastrephiae]MBM0231330.1 transcriptional regulator [Micromonospora parastrephiae]
MEQEGAQRPAHLRAPDDDLRPVRAAEFAQLARTGPHGPSVPTPVPARYVEVRKGYVGKRPRTWINLSAAGRSALSAHIAALQDIATRVTRPD